MLHYTTVLAQHLSRSYAPQDRSPNDPGYRVFASTAIPTNGRRLPQVKIKVKISAQHRRVGAYSLEIPRSWREFFIMAET